MSTESSHDEPRAFRFAEARISIPDDGAEMCGCHLPPRPMNAHSLAGSSAIRVPDWPSSVLYPPLSEDPEEGNR